MPQVIAIIDMDDDEESGGLYTKLQVFAFMKDGEDASNTSPDIRDTAKSAAQDVSQLLQDYLEEWEDEGEELLLAASTEIKH